jgi:predicted nucleotidyltransferase
LTGTDTEQSDLDLLVNPAESTSLLTLAAFRIDAEKLLGEPVSVLAPKPGWNYRFHPRAVDVRLGLRLFGRSG